MSMTTFSNFGIIGSMGLWQRQETQGDGTSSDTVDWSGRSGQTSLVLELCIGVSLYPKYPKWGLCDWGIRQPDSQDVFLVLHFEM